MKGIITIIIIIIIVVAGFFLLRDGTQDANVTEDASTITSEVPAPGTDGSVEEMIVNTGDTAVDTTVEIIVVTYNNQGFTPKEIVVSAGQTVRFVNEGSGNMWIASANHPTHTLLSGLDQKETGDSYEFQFDESGSWKYHNHVNPSKGGTVTVE